MNKIVSVLALLVACSQVFAKMTPSDMSMAMFRSALIKEPTVFKAKVSVEAWDSVAPRDKKPMEKVRDLFLAVRVSPYNAKTEQSTANHICYVKKSSEAGKIVASALKDGGIHAALVSLRYSGNPDFEGVCVLDEIEMLEGGTSQEISVKFSATRIGIVRHKDYDMVEGKITATVKSQLKFFKRPVLRVVVLTEENGSLVVRDSLMDEPNIKVLSTGSDTLLRYTTTDGSSENESPAFGRYVEELSKNQTEVSKAVFSTVSYYGLPMGFELRRTIKGTFRKEHIFGYAKFDKDENAKMIGCRIEMWYRGNCVATYDTIKSSDSKKYQLPEDWHVSFMHPEKFKYRSPFSSKSAVRR